MIKQTTARIRATRAHDPPPGPGRVLPLPVPVCLGGEDGFARGAVTYDDGPDSARVRGGGGLCGTDGGANCDGVDEGAACKGRAGLGPPGFPCTNGTLAN